MAENNFWIIMAVIVAVVAIVAVFGMVTMTGYGIRLTESPVCRLIPHSCQEGCALTVACARSSGQLVEAGYLQSCLDRCGVGGGNAKCDTYTTCTTCNQYTADGCRWSRGVCSYCPDCLSEACVIEQL